MKSLMNERTEHEEQAVGDSQLILHFVGASLNMDVLREAESGAHVHYHRCQQAGNDGVHPNLDEYSI